MNHAPLLFLGILATLASSFWGLILMPQIRLGRQEVVSVAATGELYPVARPGQAQAGAEVYRELGCAECHTRQVRPRQFGSDFERGWGLRFTVAQDYLRDYPVLLGNLRLGPDLANIGLRQTNVVWHRTHLYDPKETSPGSLMPRYPFLFEERKLAPGQKRSPEALPINRPGFENREIVPTEDANNLVAYLLSLQASVPLFESPLPAKRTNAAPAVTNAPVTATNQAEITNAPAPAAGNPTPGTQTNPAPNAVPTPTTDKR